MATSAMDSALDLMRRLPPQNVQENLSNLVDLCPAMTVRARAVQVLCSAPLGRQARSRSWRHYANNASNREAYSHWR